MERSRSSRQPSRRRRRGRGNLALGPVPSVAQTPRRIDVHIHHGSPGWVPGMPQSDVTPLVTALKDWPVSRMLEEMDRAGTGLGMLSLTAPGI